MRLRRGLVAAAALVTIAALSGCSPASDSAPSGAATATTGAAVDQTALLGDDPATLSPSLDAPVTLVEFADYQCPPCGMVSGTMTDLAEKYPDELTVVIRNFPLAEIHANATVAAHAAEAARLQGSFPEMYKALFTGQDEWSDLDQAAAEGVFEGYAEDIGLDVDRFNADRAGDEIATLVDADLADGAAVGVAGTPTLFLDGQQLEISSLDELTQAVESRITLD
ncbi:DsbA family protein [Mycetocola reblochoni]|nr:thioredoxin domain-containing protein [Mycetocola reblochoni]